MTSHRHKSHRRKPEAEAEEDRKQARDEEGNPRVDEAGMPVYEDEVEPEEVDPKDTPEHKAFMASVCQIACGLQELTKAGCPAPDAARICETVWCHQNGATIKSLEPTE